MLAFHCDHHEVPLPAAHRFPMEKYRRVRERLLAEGLLAPGELVPAPFAPREALLRAHTAGWVDAVLAGTVDPRAWRRVGFPWSEALVRRSLASTGGTLAAAAVALDEGAAGVLAGGTHHAGPDAGEGYCVFNDLAVAFLDLRARGRLRRAAVVDLDVHQGNGTAAILRGRDDVFLLSVHGARNWPFVKVDGTLDLALPDGADDQAFLDAVDQGLARVWASDPELVLYQAGVDPLAEDRLGRLSVTLAGLAERDRMVLEGAFRRSVPVVTTLGGGYADPAERTVEAHVQTWRVLRAVWG